MARRPAKPTLPVEPAPAPEPEAPTIREFQRRLTAVAAEWCRQLRSSSEIRVADDGRPGAVVKPSPGLVEPFELEPLLHDTPLGLIAISDRNVRDDFRRQSLRLLSEVVAFDSGLRLRLCELATEAAAGSCLIEPEDTFEVTLNGVLTAAALANLFVVLARLTKRRTGTVEDVQLVAGPLELLAEQQVSRAPGDVWIALLAARTANALMHRAAKETATLPETVEGQTSLHPVTAFGLAAAAVIRHSGLMKLVDAPRIHPAIAEAVHRQDLPDVPVIATRPGCGAARRLLASEVAHRLAKHPDRPEEGAALAALLQTLDAFDEPEQRLAASLLVGHLVWELLESDWLMPSRPPKATARGGRASQAVSGKIAVKSPPVVRHLLQTVTSRGAADEPLIQAIRQFEAHASQRFDGEAALLAERVVRIRDCLTGYDAYRLFLQKRAPAAADLSDFRISLTTENE